jgi:tRNA 5-methylaminomethyl-2-thiouridine biosynthesis bifunctional protein
MPRCTLGGDGHAIPIDGERLLLGPVGPHDSVATADDPHADSALAWRRFADTLRSPLEPLHLGAGHAGVRVATRDHLPMVGPLPDFADPGRSGTPLRDALPGLWLATAFGGRGLLWSVLAAELIAAAIEGEPAPVERSLADRLCPGRFLFRAPHARGARLIHSRAGLS